jgi:uncharacterized protein (TIGR00255 family)
VAGLSSMTGFARAEGEADGVAWVWEARSVNGRALDLRLRLPPGYDALETPARAALARLCRRGSVSATLTVNRLAPSAIRVNRAMLAQIVALLGDLAGELAAAGIAAAPPRLDGLIGLRGIVEVVEDEAEDVVERRRAAVADGWALALDRLVSARRDEGARLYALLSRQRAELLALLDMAAGLAAVQPEALRARLAASLAELAGLVPAMPEERLTQELALLVVRADVREELDRLRAHIAQAGELLERGEAANGPVGRQLDFLCQELNREANTLCSKSADIELTRVGLALKTAIEQFREQVQNVE